MAQYETVQWQPEDEVTSQKLNQMAQNDEYLNDNLVPGRIHYQLGANGENQSGETPRIETAGRFEVIKVDFNSQTSRSWYDFWVPFPPVFTEPPIAFVTLATDAGTDMICKFVTVEKTRGMVRIKEYNGVNKQFIGTVSILLIGK